MCQFIPGNFVLLSSGRPIDVPYGGQYDTLYLIFSWLSHGGSMRDPPLLLSQVNPVHEFTNYTSVEEYPRALMRAMEENPPNARWDFANRNYLIDLE